MRGRHPHNFARAGGQLVAAAMRAAQEANKPSAGPWTLQPIGDETKCNVLSATREIVATVKDADGPLIGSAPELLEALRAISENAKTMEPAPYQEWLWDIGMPDARAAIAKAEGREG
jgi:hypothetical protein